MTWTYETDNDETAQPHMVYVDAKRDDGGFAYVITGDDGTGGLVVTVYASPGVRIEVGERDDNEGTLVFRTAEPFTQLDACAVESVRT